eukprot:TRINITY_DN43721_c0_g1_i1.p1 TRINITY_DN43721_c0_g1~~TRINITY_DN43721_c0_g1_i1.p1  ORF type:complete len:1098 (-),score=119.06 TRINITY_DN43721_c0_g1_i1:51-3344(-)
MSSYLQARKRQEMQRPTQLDRDDATTAAKLVRSLAVWISGVVLIGSVLLPFGASRCCQLSLLFGNTLLWMVSAPVSLVYLVRHWQLDAYRPNVSRSVVHSTFHLHMDPGGGRPIVPLPASDDGARDVVVTPEAIGSDDQLEKTRVQDSSAGTIAQSKASVKAEAKSKPQMPAHWALLHQEPPPQRERYNLYSSFWKMLTRRMGPKSTSPSRSTSGYMPLQREGSLSDAQTHERQEARKKQAEHAASEASRLLDEARSVQQSVPERAAIESVEEPSAHTDSILVPVQPASLPPREPPRRFICQWRLTGCGKCILVFVVLSVVCWLLLPVVMPWARSIRLPYVPIPFPPISISFPHVSISGLVPPLPNVTGIIEAVKGFKWPDIDLEVPSVKVPAIAIPFTTARIPAFEIPGFTIGGHANTRDETRQSLVSTTLAPASSAWSLGLWGQCNALCGYGQRRRDVWCPSEFDSYCLDSGLPPSDVEDCISVESCRWKVSPWGECSTTCGVGLQKRAVACSVSNIEFCDQRSGKPSEEKVCHSIFGCKWSVGEWSACSTKCGIGNRSRDVTCNSGNSEDCRAEAVKPDAVKSCHELDGCRWLQGEWGPCDNQCGSGQQRRTFICADSINHGGVGAATSDDCLTQVGPNHIQNGEETRKDCRETAGCRWSPQPWGPCSNSCGSGTHHRDVPCANGAFADCAAHSAPPVEVATCTSHRGCEWQIGPWSVCSTDCGSGRMTRSVSCSSGNATSCILGGHAEPDRTIECRDYSGCRWEVGQWSSCTSACGDGSRSREVHCANGNVELCYLSRVEPPGYREPCPRTIDCAGWVIGEWSACSTTCGTGMVHRHVFCGDASFGVFGHGNASVSSDSVNSKLQCPEAAPMTSRPCNKMPSCATTTAAAALAPSPQVGAASVEGESVPCVCDTVDPVLPLAGALNALAGWSVGVTLFHFRRGSAYSKGIVAEVGSWHELLNKATANVLSPVSVFVFGSFAFLYASVLGGFGVGIAAFLTDTGCSHGVSNVLVASGWFTASLISVVLLVKAVTLLVAPFRIASRPSWWIPGGLLLVVMIYSFGAMLTAIAQAWFAHSFAAGGDKSREPSLCLR